MVIETQSPGGSGRAGCSSLQDGGSPFCIRDTWTCGCTDRVTTRSLAFLPTADHYCLWGKTWRLKANVLQSSYELYCTAESSSLSLAEIAAGQRCMSHMRMRSQVVSEYIRYRTWCRQGACPLLAAHMYSERPAISATWKAHSILRAGSRGQDRADTA